MHLKKNYLLHYYHLISAGVNAERNRFMSLFGTKEKKEIARLKEQLTPEQISLAELQGKIEESTERLNTILHQIDNSTAELASLKNQIIETDEEILLQSFGLYAPRYSFTTVDEYKEKLTSIRNWQKAMIKDKTAVTGATNWQVNGSAAQGRKMVANMQKLLLRAFNAECDDIVEHVKFSNLESSVKRIGASREAISKLGAMMGITVTEGFYQLKIEELYLAHEYQVKKQEEKEALKEARARMREEAKLAKELEEARKNIEKEQKHYSNALKKIEAQIQSAGESNEELLEKKAEIVAQLEKLESAIKDVDYRAANQKAGYVYVISNIGAFGPDVYKIGMTRRLDPTERVDELGDASVPFNFDVHAMIFSDDAPALEAALHRAFADRKLNFVNTRREFFRVTLDEIKAVVKANFDKTVEFIDVPPAEQYRQSLLMAQQANRREGVG
jgi:predicted  nucleic acid-binding Zn-ribbon protein